MAFLAKIFPTFWIFKKILLLTVCFSCFLTLIALKFFFLYISSEENVVEWGVTQEQALDILKTGANVFLTGEPGAGKTHTINTFVDYLRRCDVDPAVTASTGIAATHIGGMTIHS